MNRQQITYREKKFKTMFLSATVAMLVEYAMALTDKVIVGNMLNEKALAALTLVEPFTFFLAFFAFILNGITGVPFTSELGKGDKKKADQIICQSAFLAVIIGVVIMGSYIIFTDQLLQPLTQNKEILSYTYDYFYNIRFIAIPMLLNAVAYPFVLYQGGEKYCNISALCSISSNFILSIVLCKVIGMKGISFGTLAGNILGLLPLLAFAFTEKGKVEISFYLNLRELIKNMTYSLGEAMRYLYMAVLQLVMNRFLMYSFGVDTIIIFTGIINLLELFSSMVDGIEEFLLTMIEMYREEDNHKGCMKTMSITMKAAVTEGVLLTMGSLLFAPLFPKMLGITNGALQIEIIKAVRIYAVSAVFFEIMDVYTKYYLYTNKLKQSFIFTALQNLIVPFGCAIVLGIEFGIRGVWMGLSISQMVVCLILLFYAKRKDSGKNGLFLDDKKMQQEWIWDVPMTESGIAGLVENIQQIFEKQGIEQTKQNGLLQATEQSQYMYMHKNPHAEKELIECSLLIRPNDVQGKEEPIGKQDKKIILILRNTGTVSNLLSDKKKEYESLQKLLNDRCKMEISYALVNGSNRLMFKV